MSLSPSNGISEQITGRKAFPNIAGMGREDPGGTDALLAHELSVAGIPSTSFPECLRYKNEPCSVTVGVLEGWLFQRAWYYWIVTGPGMPVEDAMRLHEVHGTSVRVEGHCGCPSPLEYRKGWPVTTYHVDNPEGLKALADAIRDVAERGRQMLAAQQKGIP